ncbi:MAG: cysteine synthase A [Lachnospiraceae bacterium]|nr:cysteine synthase A [Lachnospiraceae bacterium]
MGKIYKSVTELIGHTPLLELSNIEKEYGLKAKLLAKLEYFNPAGSAKDRVGFAMIEDAKKRGVLKEGTVIIEPTSGNTGIGLACVAASQGYRVIIVMPDSMSVERIKTMEAYGAEVVLTPGSLGMKGAIEKANELADSFESSFIPGQFENPANALAHETTTGPEIFEDTDGEVDIFVAGIGTGGTISGTGRYLKSKKPDVKIVGFEPSASPFITEGKSGVHKLQGIGAGFIPEVLDTKVYDEVLKVDAEDAFNIGRLLAAKEGILVGITSGAAAYVGIELAKKPENEGKTIVVLLPDSGNRYLSSEMFA